MSIPTDGYTAGTVTYTFNVSGPFILTLEMSAEVAGLSIAEDLVSALDGALPDVATAIADIDTVDSVTLSKSYDGFTASEDL